jgi:hypothetical protein
MQGGVDDLRVCGNDSKQQPGIRFVQNPERLASTGLACGVELRRNEEALRARNLHIATNLVAHHRVVVVGDSAPARRPGGSLIAVVDNRQLLTRLPAW